MKPYAVPATIMPSPASLASFRKFNGWCVRMLAACITFCIGSHHITST